MGEAQVQLAFIWVALMLVYLLGDVLRIFSGDYLRGDTDINAFTQPMWLGISVLMVLPIIMILMTLMLPQPLNRWINIIVAAFFFLFNLVGLPTYVGLYDKFLIVIGLVFNVITVWLAWHWTPV
ncbi:MAG: hypothetical protein OHK0046_00280 [Anaerolineae bacterium]